VQADFKSITSPAHTTAHHIPRIQTVPGTAAPNHLRYTARSHDSLLLLAVHDLGVWSHCYRRASYPTLILHTPIHPQAKDRPGQSRGESAQVRMPSQRLVGRRACRHIHNRSSSSSSSSCSLAKVRPEPLHAAVRVTNFAQRRHAHIHSSTAYAYAHTTHTSVHDIEPCGSTCRFLN